MKLKLLTIPLAAIATCCVVLPGSWNSSFVAAAPTGWLQDEDQDGDEKSDTEEQDVEDEEDVELTPQEKYKAIRTEYDEARKAYRAASKEEREDLDSPSPGETGDKFIALAKEHPDNPVAFKSLSWVVSNVRRGKGADEAMELLLADHIENKGMTTVCSMLGRKPPSQDTEDSIRLLLEKSPHESVKAYAAFTLANYFKSLMATQARRAEKLAEKAEEGEPESPKVDYVSKSKVDEAMIEEMYQFVVDEFPDVSISSRAESALFELRYLTIGKTAPDIEGKDLDGEAFKLSDYRGKVVVIDFWGDW